MGGGGQRRGRVSGCGRAVEGARGKKAGVGWGVNEYGGCGGALWGGESKKKYHIKHKENGEGKNPEALKYKEIERNVETRGRSIA